MQSCKLVLAVRARMPYDQVQRQFIQQSKSTLPTKSAAWSACRSPGIPLHTLTAAPRQLPWHEGYVYFELEKTPGLAGRDKSGRAGAAYLRRPSRSEPSALGDKGISE
ncbi:type VI secretion system baseplate subunit TssK [Escherichia coli]|nr:type VI secretion system baseplate subunit TssK [Escherichia coli]